MKPKAMICAVFGLTIISVNVRAAEETESSVELPKEYATNYLVASDTISPDKNLAIIYPTLDYSESKDAKDLLVALKPFRVLTALPTDDPYFQNKNHGGLSAEWSKDGSVALISLESKWGPGDVFLVELSSGKVKRTTNLLGKLTQVLLPKFRAAMPKAANYNDNYAFIFEPIDPDAAPCALDGNTAVKIDLSATNDPKSVSEHPWRMRVQAEWDIAAAKFTSQKITKDLRE